MNYEIIYTVKEDKILEEMKNIYWNGDTYDVKNTWNKKDVKNTWNKKDVKNSWNKKDVKNTWNKKDVKNTWNKKRHGEHMK